MRSYVHLTLFDHISIIFTQLCLHIFHSIICRFKGNHREAKKVYEDVQSPSACLKATTFVEFSRNNTLHVKTEST